MLDLIRQPWPWYVAGPLIGLTIPLLLIIGNRSFGISSSLRHVCAACAPANIPFFKYEWKKEVWNMFFALGIILGGFVGAMWLMSPDPVAIHPDLLQEVAGYGITNTSQLIPVDVVNWSSLLTLKGFLLIVGGGFMIGFGSRYAGGCTSGHAIMGISTLQLPSLVATCCFMIGGFIMANLILPFILNL